MMNAVRVYWKYSFSGKIFIEARKMFYRTEWRRELDYEKEEVSSN